MATTPAATKQSRKNKATDASGPGGPWSGHAPRRLRRAYAGDSGGDGWTLWCQHLHKRKLRPLAKLFKGRTSPLFWAVPPGIDTKGAEQVVELLRRPKVADRRTSGLENAVQCWLSRAEVAAHDVAFALECLAWCAALPALAEHVGEVAWWQLANRLFAVAGAPPDSDDPLAVQMLHGELPATLAYLLPELAASESLVSASRRTLEHAADELVADDGMVHGERLDDLRPLVACWTRWRRIGRELESSIWRDATPRRYSRLVEYALRLSRADGTPLFSSPETPRWNRRLVRAALDLAGSARARRVADLIASGGKDSGSPRRRSPSPSINLESAGVAVLRADWRRRGPQLAVNYSGRQHLLEFSLGRRQLFSGAATIALEIDGRAIAPRQGWEQICSESDRDVVYLELEQRFSEDIAVQRHLLLAREAGFLLVADAVLGSYPRKIAYRATVPLAANATFRPEKETHEGILDAGGRARARLLPLELAEWRSGPWHGSLAAADDGSLELVEEAHGCCLFAPLFIDFDARRLGREATWRQLTVGEDRQVVPRDTAVGYRVQVGKLQWLVYRSLGEVGVRTVLGQNLRHEFLVGRFGSKGKVKKLVEIEV